MGRSRCRRLVVGVGSLGCARVEGGGPRRRIFRSEGGNGAQERQLDDELGAAGVLRPLFDIQATSVVLHGLEGEREADPGAVTLRGEEGFEDALPELGGNPGSLVADVDGDPTGRQGLRADAQGASGGHRVRGVQEQVQEYTLQLHEVGDHRVFGRLQAGFHGNPIAVQLGAHEGEGFLHEVVKGPLRGFHRMRPAQLQNAGDHPLEPADFREADPDLVRCGLGKRSPVHVPRQRLEVELYRAERVADLVSEVGRQLAQDGHSSTPLDLEHHASDALGHSPDGERQSTDLVLTGRREPGIQLTLSDPVSRVAECLHRADEAIDQQTEGQRGGEPDQRDEQPVALLDLTEGRHHSSHSGEGDHRPWRRAQVSEGREALTVGFAGRHRLVQVSREARRAVPAFDPVQHLSSVQERPAAGYVDEGPLLPVYHHGASIPAQPDVEALVAEQDAERNRSGDPADAASVRSGHPAAHRDS